MILEKKCGTNGWWKSGYWKKYFLEKAPHYNSWTLVVNKRFLFWKVSFACAIL